MKPSITNMIWLMPLAIALVECTAAAVAAAAAAESPLEKHYVVIWNDLGKNHTLVAHCKSKTKDMGEVKIAQGKSVKWEIEKPTSNTHFCDMSYENHRGHFDVFVEDRDLDLCDGECRWYARTDGLFIHYNNGEITQRMYTWSNE